MGDPEVDGEPSLVLSRPHFDALFLPALIFINILSVRVVCLKIANLRRLCAPVLRATACMVAPDGICGSS